MYTYKMDSRREKREHIFTEAHSARQILEKLRDGDHVFDPQATDPAHIDKRILQLMHLRQYARMYQYCFQEWTDNDSIHENEYLEVARETQSLYDIVNHDVFKETLAELLIVKHDQTQKLGAEIHEENMQRMGQMWIDAGLISSLKTNTEKGV